MSTTTLLPATRKSHANVSKLDEIESGLALLSQLIEVRVRQITGSVPEADKLADIQRAIENLELIPERECSYAESVALLLAISPNLQSDLLDRAFLGSLDSAGDYPEIGGIRGQHYRGFLPTAQTVLFLLNPASLGEQVDFLHMFNEDHFFASEDILSVRNIQNGEPGVSGRLAVEEDFLTKLVTGHPASPKFSMEFPAQHLTTDRQWGDLVLTDDTHSELEHIKFWLTHRDRVLHDWGMAGLLRTSYTCLFFGPSGSGKTFTASLFGQLGYPVYRIDLAMVVSKFIGDTEKNLEKVFRRAERKNWILFFDEADALFSKRTGVRDAHDKYANQEVAYLLQRVEQFSGSGLVILASNLKGNIDSAFLRRFQSVVYFPRPEVEHRVQIWKKMLPERVSVDNGVSLDDIFRRYEVSGGGVVNILQYCLIRIAARNSTTIEYEDILAAVAAEYRKEGKTA